MKVKKDTTPISSIIHRISFAQTSEINHFMVDRYEQYDYLYDTKDAQGHLTEQIHSMQDIADTYGEEANRRYADALLEYEPLWNVDYTEDGENHNRGTGSGSNSSTQTPHNWKTVNSGSDTEVQTPNGWKVENSGSDTETQTPTNWRTVNNGGHTDTHSDAGYNNITDSQGRVVTMTPTSADGNSHNDTTEQQGTFTTQMSKGTKSEQKGTYTTQNTKGTSVEQQGTFTVSGSNSSSSSDDGSHHIRKTGNYGVTSSQDLLKQQFETETLRNVMDWYISKFAVCFDLRIEGVEGLW